MLHHTSGRLREQVSCTAALAWASLGDLMENHVLIDVERHIFCIQSSVEPCNVYFSIFSERGTPGQSEYFGVVGYAFLSAEERIRM